MSDFFNDFWSNYVAAATLVSIVLCGVLLWLMARAPTSKGEGSTTGHVWAEDLREANNPMPRWWIGLFAWAGSRRLAKAGKDEGVRLLEQDGETFMSDFFKDFWSNYGAAATLVSIVRCGVLLWLMARAPSSKGEGSTTGHVWDEDLREANNPMPRWWIGLFV